MNDKNKVFFKTFCAAVLSLCIALECGCCSMTAYAANTAAAEVICGDVSTGYDSCDSAWTAAEKECNAGRKPTIKLLSDWYPSHGYNISAGKSITLDLNGYRADRRLRGKMSGNGYVFKVNGVFTVTDSNPESERYSNIIRGGVITGGAGDGCGGGIIVASGATLNMYGGSVVGCVSNYHGGAIFADDNSSVNIENVGFYSNMTYDSTDSCYGGALYADTGSRVNIKSTVFENNYSEDSGGAVYLNCGTMYASGCLFNGNKCLDDGGALFSDSSSLFSSGDGSDVCLESCILENNRADGCGGAVYISSDNITRLMYSALRYNYSAENGGALYVNGDNVCIMDTDILSNNCGGLGGGVYVDSMYDINVQGRDRIFGNTRGGATADNLFLSDGRMSSAHIFNGGLTDDACIGVGTDSDSSGYTVIKLTGEYQQKFFTSDNSGRQLVFAAEKGREQRENLIASAISERYSVFSLCAVLLLLAVGTIIAVIVRLRKKEQNTNRNGGESGEV